MREKNTLPSNPNPSHSEVSLSHVFSRQKRQKTAESGGIRDLPARKDPDQEGITAPPVIGSSKGVSFIPPGHREERVFPEIIFLVH
ncbi:hypothetical protein CEXT_292551 [Caerostris extrusa]|uniref:Ycf15 n=1 Tax=Caerostris extrusa TaxID=172846 RepID=A0AAV4WA19_CAEEX|nr:hypothetical protein CEXT_292551 [Caerostris extrusa]